MKIEALSNFVVPSMPAFYTGKQYDIMEEDAKQLINRGLAKEVKTQTMVEQVYKKRTSKKVAKK